MTSRPYPKKMSPCYKPVVVHVSKVAQLVEVVLGYDVVAAAGDGRLGG
jgi:hypothetical protein